MKPIHFREVNVTFAKEQPQYNPLPAWRGIDGTVISCWRMTWRERFRVLFTGHVWVRMLTFNRPLQPLNLGVERPFVREE